MKTLARVLLLLLCSLAATGATADMEALRADTAFFADSSCSQLKTGVKPEALKGFQSELLKDVAAAMLLGRYDTTYRAAVYQAYPSPRALDKALKLGDGFSRYENITGMYLKAGEHVVFVGPTQGKEIVLLIPDWLYKPAEKSEGWGLRRQAVALDEGPNRIHVEKGGNAYISYYDDDAEAAPRITVHFVTGQVNGYFDITRHDNDDFNRLLDNAVSPILDARGRHIQVAYPVEWFNEYTRGKGVELIDAYDKILHHHYTLMGYVKYDKMPKNRMLARVNYHAYMFRDRDGVAYRGDKSTMRKVADPDNVTRGDACWGFCHEAGHVLQMRPQLTWGGMTEVSCNIFSMYTTQELGNESRLSRQKDYAKARKTIIEAEPKRSYLTAGVFERLVPFWQLHLYFSCHSQPDFYADVMEELRNRPHAGAGNESIRNQFQFIKVCCDVSKTDLTEFFEKWGFFWVGELTVKDYGTYHFKITQEMVDETKAYIASKNYKKPDEDITLIED